MIPIDLFRSWLENKNLKVRTIQEYLYYLEKFGDFKFNQENVQLFLSNKSNMNPVARCLLINLKRFLLVNYKQLGLTNEERMDIGEVEFPRVSGRLQQRLISPLSEEQILEIEKFLPDEQRKLMLVLSYYGGLRAGELMKIQISSFNWENWKHNKKEYGECRVFGKGDKERIAFFSPKMMYRIAEYIRSGTYQTVSGCLFIRKIDDPKTVNISHRLTHWERCLKRAAVAAGITKRDSHGKLIRETNVYPHRLRHSWGYYLKNVKKMDIRDIKEILGHSSIVSTQRYVYTDTTNIKKLLREEFKTS